MSKLSTVLLTFTISNLIREHFPAQCSRYQVVKAEDQELLFYWKKDISDQKVRDITGCVVLNALKVYTY